MAPTKELVSLRAYSVTRRLNRLRRDACALFTGDAFVAMTNKLEREINCGRMSLRKDRNVFADLGKIIFSWLSLLDWHWSSELLEVSISYSAAVPLID